MRDDSKKVGAIGQCRRLKDRMTADEHGMISNIRGVGGRDGKSGSARSLAQENASTVWSHPEGFGVTSTSACHGEEIK